MEYKELGRRIKQRRIELGINQQELAEKVGYTSKVAISRIESGDIDIPMTKMLLICDALGMNITSIFNTYSKVDLLDGLSDGSRLRALEYIETLRRADLWQNQNGTEKDGGSGSDGMAR